MKFIVLILLSIAAISCKDENVQPVIIEGWVKESPQVNGLNPDSVNKAIANAKESDSFLSLIVTKNNKLIVEEYFEDHTRDSLYQLRSITKTITSALTFVAIDNGIISSIDELLGTFIDTLDLDKSSITIHHLLNMTSGLSWNEKEDVFPLLEHIYADPNREYLGRNLIAEPGTEFNYSTASSHVVTAILEQQSDLRIEELATIYLSEKLDVAAASWEVDPNGRAWGGTGLQLRAIDLAKFGQMILNNGQWESEQVVDPFWIDQMRTIQVERNSGNTDFSYNWWVTTGEDYQILFALGYGGQVLMLIPELNMQIIAFQRHFVSPEQDVAQWQFYLNEVFNPIYNGIE